MTIIFLGACASCCAQGIGPEDKVISIFFGGGSYWMDEEQSLRLSDFIFDVERLNEYDIEVHGHTNDIGSVEYNQYLSEMRSRTVISYLMTLDMDFHDIKKIDFGELNPVYDNDSWSGRLNNRRVDVVLRKLML